MFAARHFWAGGWMSGCFFFVVYRLYSRLLSPSASIVVLAPLRSRSCSLGCFSEDAAACYYRGRTFLRLNGTKDISGSLWELALFASKLRCTWELFLDLPGSLVFDPFPSSARKVASELMLAKRWEFFEGLPFTYFLFISTKLLLFNDFFFPFFKIWLGV